MTRVAGQASGAVRLTRQGVVGAGAAERSGLGLLRTRAASGALSALQLGLIAAADVARGAVQASGAALVRLVGPQRARLRRFSPRCAGVTGRTKGVLGCSDLGREGKGEREREEEKYRSPPQLPSHFAGVPAQVALLALTRPLPGNAGTELARCARLADPHVSALASCGEGALGARYGSSQIQFTATEVAERASKPLGQVRGVGLGCPFPAEEAI